MAPFCPFYYLFRTFVKALNFLQTSYYTALFHVLRTTHHNKLCHLTQLCSVIRNKIKVTNNVIILSINTNKWYLPPLRKYEEVSLTYKLTILFNYKMYKNTEVI